MSYMYAGDYASGCKCQDEIGDYSHCPRHRDNSKWAKQQLRQDRLRVPAAPHQGSRREQDRR